MRVTVVPALQALRSIYTVEGVMPRFEAYVNYMTGGPELLPLGAFSPMGRQQPDYLDQLLLGVKAEDIAQSTADQVTTRLSFVPDHYKLVLVVVDAPPGKNTWTHRWVTDAEWRLETKYDAIAKADDSFDRWVTVQLWTDIPATASYIEQETQTTLFRAAHQSLRGIPRTLQDYLQQEGRAMAFANGSVELDSEDLDYSRQVLEPLLQSDHHPTCFAALYGDEIAKQVGYPPLGLSSHAGFQVGLADAMLEGCPEFCLEKAIN